MTNYETRVIPANDLRLLTQDDGTHIIGKAIAYDARSALLKENGLQFYEVIAPGAAKHFLATGPSVKMLRNHNTDYPLGNTKSGTLTLTETNDGVYVDCTLPDTTYARDLAISIKRGDVEGMSFRFANAIASWTTTEDGNRLRIVEQLAFDEVSPATFPAYPDTSVAMRSLEVLEQKEQLTLEGIQNQLAEVKQLIAAAHVVKVQEVQDQDDPPAVQVQEVQQVQQVQEVQQVDQDDAMPLDLQTHLWKWEQLK